MAAIATPLAQLSADELDTINALRAHMLFGRVQHAILNAYYDAEMRIQSLGIAIPPALNQLRAVVGWPGVVVDSVDDRLDVEGFRMGDATDADMHLWDLWQASNMDAESQLAHLDALVYGRAYATVGSPDKAGDAPIICVESPRHLAHDYDPRTKRITAAFREYEDAREVFGVLYLPDETLYLERHPSGWSVYERDRHMLGQVPVVPIVNRARIADRDGRSEITPAVMSITDSACRTMLGMEVAREFFGAPQRYILGATESDFQDASGNPKTAWQTYMGRVLAFERDEAGHVPEVGTFAASSPATFTALLDAYAKVMSSITGLPPSYFGMETVIPASADAIRMGTDRLVQKVRRKQRAMGAGWEDVMRLALQLDGGGRPVEARSMETLWRDPEIPTPAATSQALLAQVTAGIVPAASDVVLERLGYSAVERERLTADRQAEGGAADLTAMARELAIPARAMTEIHRLGADAPKGGQQPAGSPAGQPANSGGS